MYYYCNMICLMQSPLYPSDKAFWVKFIFFVQQPVSFTKKRNVKTVMNKSFLA